MCRGYFPGGEKLDKIVLSHKVWMSYFKKMGETEGKLSRLLHPLTTFVAVSLTVMIGGWGIQCIAPYSFETL